LDPSQFEVIVIDNCSDDNTDEMVREIQATMPFSLRYQRTETNRGQIYSRNTGARLAQAQILAFTDSDCRVTPCWLDSILDGFTSESLGFVTGPVRNKPEQAVTFFSLATFENSGENITYPACNVAYRKEAFWLAKGFDESAWPGDFGDKSFGDSDTDLAWRVKELGYTSTYVESALVYHHVWPLTISQWFKAHLMAWRVPSVVKKSPQVRQLIWWGPFLFFDNLLFYLAVFGVLLGLVHKAWWWFLVVPHLWRMFRVPGRPFSLSALPTIASRVVFLSLRQATICAALIYGSWRARTIVL
jgi:glycosyltransferase involved in cell wall biosynthesis